MQKNSERSAKARQNLRVQRRVAIISVLLLLVKFTAWYFTRSVAVLTDALESIVNVVAGLLGLYSLYVAAKPRDKDHPYGHGKAEFLSSAVEGTLIAVAGVIILYKGIMQLYSPAPLHRLDTGLWLISVTAVVNFLVGYSCIRTGKKNDSLLLIASGRHLQTDTLSTLGIIAGLALILLTGIAWIDGAVAVIFAIIIIISGYGILRQSVAGIMDEADSRLLTEMIFFLDQNRRENWVDLHNLRVIKYGSVLHVDCHLTVPWFLNVHEAHREIDALAALVRGKFGETVELFVHSDGCLAFQCHICNKQNCPERQHAFEKQVKWTTKNVLQNQKHQPEDI